jgi:hypothetical protein
VSTVAITPELSLFGEYRHRKSEGGDRQIDFDIEDFDPTLRSEVAREVARIGFHAQPTYNSDLLGVYSWAKLQSHDTIEDILFGTLDGQGVDKSDNWQLLYIWQGERWRGLFGGTYIDTTSTATVDFGGLFNFANSFNAEYWNGYSYLYLDWPRDITWTFGGALASYEEADTADGADIDKFLPKLGVRARLADRVTVRASYLENLKPNLVSDQVIEPTAVAGFNQFYDSFNGAQLEQAGVGLDFALSDDITVGGERIWRWWDVPVGGAPDAATDETVDRAFAHAVLTEELALAVELSREISHSDIFNDFEKWEAISAPITLSYFSESGLFASAQVVYVDGEFRNPGVQGHDEFAVVNVTAGIRLPDNRGILSIEALNLFDERFHFQNRSTRPDLSVAPRYAPELTVLGRLTLSF